ncbi:Uncharacterised protein [Serratia quinivorans]|nr:Uncharacterised protein [Serratia quinivorans]
MRSKILAGVRIRFFWPIARVGLLAVLLGVQAQAHAGRITISHPESEDLPNGKTLCIYTTPIYTFSVTVKGRCPVSKTFDTEDSE